MTDMIIIKPSSGDSYASLFSGPDASDTVLATVPTGTILKVVNSNGKFYTVDYDNGVENATNGGTGMTGTIVAYPYATMYNDDSKTKVLGNINNGTACEIIDDSNISMISVKAVTTEGLLTGFVDAKFIYRDIVEETPVMFRMTRTTDNNADENTGTVTASALNIRSGPGTSYGKVGLLNNGDSVTVYETKSGWHRIGTDQWVSGKHIKLASGSTETKGTVKINDNSSSLNVRSSPGVKDNPSNRVGSLKQGTVVTIHETKSGWHRITAEDYTDVWVSGKYIVVDESNSSAEVSKTDAEKIGTSDGDNWSSNELGVDSYSDIFAYNETGYTVSDDYYRQLAEKYAYALGAPPKYNMDIDVQYTDEITAGIGRVVNKTIMSNPAILSICPGKVKMFPNLIGAERDSIVDAMVGVAEGNPSLIKKINNDKPARFSGRLYKFEADTAEYSKYVNALCRACAIMLNIGDELMPDTTSKLKNFDYSYWTIRKKYDPTVAEANEAENGVNDKSLFRTFWPGLVKTGKRLVTTSVDDTTYINFFLNGNETTVQESITNSVADSPLSATFSGISSVASTLNYFTGSGFDIKGDDVKDALDAVYTGAGSTLEGLADLGENFLNGGRVVLPKMVEGFGYEKSISCNMKFVSPYGDKKSVFLKCLVPVCHALALALPKQLSDNMYTFPFLVRCAQTGAFNVDLGIITNITINRGGSDETSYTTDTIATEWEVQLEITPLVNELMMTPTNHPVLMCKNEQLLDYLANFCGFDALAYNLDTKFEMMTAFVQNIMSDIPARIENRISDALFNKLNRFFTAL